MDMIDLFFIILTGIIAYRLYVTLGVEDTDTHDINFGNFSKNRKKKEDDTFQKQEVETPLITTLKQIQHVDKDFTQERFLQGAEKAFELIVMSFIKGDKSRLQDFVSQEIFGKFSKNIESRHKKETTAELPFFRVTKVEIESMQIKNKIVIIQVFFGSEQTQLLKDKNGKILEGDPDHIDQIEEIWTFERPLVSKEPRWVLVETTSAS
jgi:predicted lipid-binding transport protein (Tim44 family)